MPLAESKNSEIIPVDSEHNAIHQCFPRPRDLKEISKIMITASGGPFREKTFQDLNSVTLSDALNHPTWNMGPKITIDSATLANKCLELIEAHYLFQIPESQIEIVVHPQSIIHSMVTFIDGSTIAQMSNPNMEVPIANALGLVDKTCVFVAFDGLHHAEIISKEKVALQMSDLTVPENYHAGTILNTGSPHIVFFENSIDELNVQERGAEIRFSKTYTVDGVNVNFVKVLKDKLLIRTYERGVENETLACGTGAVASAIAAFESGLISTQPIRLTALGGDLEVLFSKLENTYTNIRLIGSAKFVFKGSIDV